MTSLLLKDSSNKVKKLLLNPIWPGQLKVWEGDKVHIASYQLLPLACSDESFVSDLVIPLSEVINLSTKTDIETCTEGRSVRETDQEMTDTENTYNKRQRNKAIEDENTDSEIV